MNVDLKLGEAGSGNNTMRCTEILMERVTHPGFL